MRGCPFPSEALKGETDPHHSRCGQEALGRRHSGEVGFREAGWVKRVAAEPEPICVFHPVAVPIIPPVGNAARVWARSCRQFSRNNDILEPEAILQRDAEKRFPLPQPRKGNRHEESSGCKDGRLPGTDFPALRLCVWI